MILSNYSFSDDLLYERDSDYSFKIASRSI